MIMLKSPEEIAIMRQGGKILASILDKLRKEVKSGIKTRQLDELVAYETEIRGVKPSFKNSTLSTILIITLKAASSENSAI